MQHVRRWLVVLGFCAIAAAAMFVYQLIPAQPVLRYPVPQKIVASQLSLKAGGAYVTTQGTKCNDSREIVNVVGTHQWRDMEPTDGTGSIDLSDPRVGVRKPGCVTTTFLMPLPTNIYPGKWRIEGIEDTIGLAHNQRSVWYTETFEVKP